MAGGDVCSSDSFSEDVAVFSKQVSPWIVVLEEIPPSADHILSPSVKSVQCFLPQNPLKTKTSSVRPGVNEGLPVWRTE